MSEALQLCQGKHPETVSCQALDHSCAEKRLYSHSLYSLRHLPLEGLGMPHVFQVLCAPHDNLKAMSTRQAPPQRAPPQMSARDGTRPSVPAFSKTSFCKPWNGCREPPPGQRQTARRACRSMRTTSSCRCSPSTLQRVESRAAKLKK